MQQTFLHRYDLFVHSARKSVSLKWIFRLDALRQFVLCSRYLPSHRIEYNENWFVVLLADFLHNLNDYEEKYLFWTSLETQITGVKLYRARKGAQAPLHHHIFWKTGIEIGAPGIKYLAKEIGKSIKEIQDLNDCLSKRLEWHKKAELCSQNGSCHMIVAQDTTLFEAYTLQSKVHKFVSS